MRSLIKTKTQLHGFSLIELMVVVVIIGILVAVAVPMYNNSVQSARRSDAKTALLDLATREEKFYSVNNQYTTSAVALYGTGASFPLNVQSSGTTYYTIQVPTITAATATTVATFSAQATPVTGTSQENDACGTFTINSMGVTGNTGNSITSCW